MDVEIFALLLLTASHEPQVMQRLRALFEGLILPTIAASLPDEERLLPAAPARHPRRTGGGHPHRLLARHVRDRYRLRAELVDALDKRLRPSYWSSASMTEHRIRRRPLSCPALSRRRQQVRGHVRPQTTNAKLRACRSITRRLILQLGSLL
jgi:hypothetical protein